MTKYSKLLKENDEMAMTAMASEKPQWRKPMKTAKLYAIWHGNRRAVVSKKAY